jgi:hypothetical protein
VISSLPSHALLPIVPTGSEVCVEARARNPWQSIRVGPSAAGVCFWAGAQARNGWGSDKSGRVLSVRAGAACAPGFAISARESPAHASTQ